MDDGDDVVWLWAWIGGGGFIIFEFGVNLVNANNNNKKTMQSLLLVDMEMMW